MGMTCTRFSPSEQIPNTTSSEVVSDEAHLRAALTDLAQLLARSAAQAWCTENRSPSSFNNFDQEPSDEDTP